MTEYIVHYENDDDGVIISSTFNSRYAMLSFVDDYFCHHQLKSIMVSEILKMED